MNKIINLQVIFIAIIGVLTGVYLFYIGEVVDARGFSLVGISVGLSSVAFLLTGITKNVTIIIITCGLSSAFIAMFTTVSLLGGGFGSIRWISAIGYCTSSILILVSRYLYFKKRA